MLRILFDLRLVIALYICAGLFACLSGIIYLSYISACWYLGVALMLVFSAILVPFKVVSDVEIFRLKYLENLMKIFLVISAYAWLRFYLDVIRANDITNLLYLRSPEYSLKGRYDDTYFNMFSRIYIFSVIFFYGRSVYINIRGVWYYISLMFGLIFSVIMMTRAPLLGYSAALITPLILARRRFKLYSLFALLALAVFFLSFTIERDTSVVLLYLFGGLEALGLVIDGTVDYEVDKLLSLEPLYYIGSKFRITEALDYIRVYIRTSNGKTNVFTFLDAFVIDFGPFIGFVIIGLFAITYGLVLKWFNKFRGISTMFTPVLLYVNLMVFMNNEFLRIGFWISLLYIAIVFGIINLLYGRNINT